MLVQNFPKYLHHLRRQVPLVGSGSLRRAHFPAAFLLHIFLVPSLSRERKVIFFTRRPFQDIYWETSRRCRSRACQLPPESKGKHGGRCDCLAVPSTGAVLKLDVSVAVYLWGIGKRKATAGFSAESEPPMS